MTRFVLLFFTLACTQLLWSSAHSSEKSSADLFDSFRQLDAQFTQLDAGFHKLHAAVDKSRRWKAEAREVKSIAARISRISSRLCARRRQTGRSMQSRLFDDLHRRMRTLNSRLASIQHASSRRQASREMRKAQLAMLDAVLQYQAISGGYAANSCGAGTWNCGVAKYQPRRAGYPATAVKWSCVPRATACRGILGPRMPWLAPQPLTAVTLAK